MNCIGSSSTKKYMILEWSGTDGHKYIVSRSFDDAMGLFKQVLIGLVSLHRKDPNPVIVHHDLKWQNVGVDEKKCLRIIDLEDAIPGLWGNRVRGAQGYTFSTPETINNEFGFFCGLKSGTPRSLCPYAWAYDAYTAGIMMAQLFGIDLFFYLRSWASMSLMQGMRRGEARHYLSQASIFDIPSHLLFVGEDLFVRSTTKKFVQELRSSAQDLNGLYADLKNTFSAEYNITRGYELTTKRQNEAFAEMDIKMLRLNEFAKLDVSSLNVLEGLLSPLPKERSSAGQVLLTPAFINRNTLCEDDGFAEQKATLETNTKDEITRVVKVAMIKDRLPDMDPISDRQDEHLFQKEDTIPGTAYAMPLRRVQRRTDRAECPRRCTSPIPILTMQGVHVKSHEEGFLKFRCRWGKTQPPKQNLCSPPEWDRYHGQYTSACACPWIYE